MKTKPHLYHKCIGEGVLFFSQCYFIGFWQESIMACSPLKKKIQLGSGDSGMQEAEAGESLSS